MTHTHDISDTDVSFVIDPQSRAITTESNKLCLAQYDHNSEKYTFKIPRFIEGHDMSACDTIAIDFENSTRTKTTSNKGEFIVEDRLIEDDVMLFTWVVSREATQLVGFLSFSVSFRCHDESENVVYEWGTDTFKRITVLEKSVHAQTIVNKYPDVLERIRVDAMDAVTQISDERINTLIDAKLATIPRAEQANF